MRAEEHPGPVETPPTHAEAVRDQAACLRWGACARQRGEGCSVQRVNSATRLSECVQTREKRS